VPATDRAALAALTAELVECRRCPRLVEWREQVAREKVARFRNETYWARPVPGFGDPDAQILLLGLAPAAHGGNRTGRVVTGDESGNWLYAALHRAGFASQPTSVARDDGLRLDDAFVTAIARCAPPDNRPTPEEIVTCRRHLLDELAALDRVRVVVALGQIAHAGFLAAARLRGVAVPRPAPRFAHAAEHALAPGQALLCSYHPSQQNTFTGRLTAEMFDDVLRRAQSIVRDSPPTID